jgi:predicted nucleotidyltransferase
MLQALFSSRVRVKLLTYFFSRPGERCYARELARSLGEHYNAIWEELGNLEQVGLLQSEYAGSARYYHLNLDFPLYPELKSMILKTTGLGETLRAALEQLGTVEAAFVYGSVASGKEDAFSDLDLMLIGEVNLPELAKVVAQLEKQVGRAINYIVFTAQELRQRLADGDPFAENVLTGSRVMLIGDEDGLRRIAQAGTATALSGATA